MPLRIGGLPVFTPSDLATAVRSVLGWTDEAVQVLGELPGRAAALLDDVERLIARVERTVDRVDAVAEAAAEVAARADEVAVGASGVLARADAAAGAAESLVGEVGRTGRGAQELLDLYRPAAERGAPLLNRFVEEFSEEELTALVRLVDQVPRFTAHMESDIMPILATLDRVGPDVHELLDVLKDMRLAIQGVPGFALFRRRGAEKEDDPGEE